MTNFDQMILDLEHELLNLKTTGLKSSSSLAVAEKSISITQQIVGYTVNYLNDHCASQSAAIIEIIPSDGKVMLTSVALKGDGSQLANRYAIVLPTSINGHNAYEFRFVEGSSADLTTIQNNGTVAPINLEFVISGTSDFTLNLTYRQDY